MLKQVDVMVDARVDAKMTYKFSPSSLSLLKDCPRCFWLNFNKNIKRPDSIFPSLPSGMDKILKKGKKLIVLDYKTRGFPLKEDTHEHYQDQMDIYNFLLRKNGYETEDY